MRQLYFAGVEQKKTIEDLILFSGLIASLLQPLLVDLPLLLSLVRLLFLESLGRCSFPDLYHAIHISNLDLHGLSIPLRSGVSFDPFQLMALKPLHFLQIIG